MNSCHQQASIACADLSNTDTYHDWQQLPRFHFSVHEFKSAAGNGALPD